MKGVLNLSDAVIGHRLFADRVSRPVSLDDAGQQDVVGPDGGRVPGLWVLPPEVPSDPPPPSPTKRPHQSVLCESLEARRRCVERTGLQYPR